MSLVTKRSCSSWIPVTVNWIHVFALWLVLLGLIGVKKEHLDVTPISQCFDGQGQNDSICSGEVVDVPLHYNPSTDKVVLMVIDAMRVDFLSASSMPFTSDLLDRSHACLFKMNVKSPTVTLPRVKAMISGEISTYWDIVQNFNSKKMTQDNIIWHAVHDRNRKIVFYGDESWLALFPNEFTRAEGTNSFFVKDFFEVDKNVTRHLDVELNEHADWDMMILHYLGLDHIGHVEGPKSTFVPGKLQEMDSIIKRLYHYLSSIGGRSYLFVCGDHGMANIGGHGGNSYHETTTPLIVLSTAEMPDCLQRNWRNLDEVEWVEQIDLSTTLSALWGLAFPAGSAGKVIWPLLSHLSIAEKLYISNYNSRQLLKVAKEETFSAEFRRIVVRHHAFKKNYLNESEANDILKCYQDLNTRMSKIASDQLGQQNLLQMGTGVLLGLGAALLIFVQKRNLVHLIVIFVMTVVSFLFYIEQLSSIAGILLQIAVLIISYSSLARQHRCFKTLSLRFENLTWLHGINLLMPLLYFSSSFVEEEHYLCYYVWATAILSLFFIIPYTDLENPTDKSQPINGNHVHHRYTQWIQLFKVLVLLCTHRLSSAWNQTGQKWSHYEDLVDLIKELHLMQPVTIVSFLVIWWIQRQGRNALYTAILILVGHMKTNIGNGILHISFEKPLADPVHLTLLLTLLYFILQVVKKRKSEIGIFTNAFIIFTLILQKTENIPLVTMLLVQCEILTQIFRITFKNNLSLDQAQQRKATCVLLVFLFSRAAFFYQGNSNSITTIDVNAGYIGLSSYNEVLVGFLIFCNTFSLPTLIFLRMVQVTDEGPERSLKFDDFGESLVLTITKSNSVTVCIYSVAIFMLRHHLFIWSVFAPKLFYVIGFTIYYAMITSIYALISEIKFSIS